MQPRATLDDDVDLDRLRKRTSQKWARYDEHVLPAFVAETDFPVPPEVARVLHAAIENGDLGYAQPIGLGEAYSSFASERYGTPVDPTSVRAVPEVMVGATEILRVTTEPGDGVVVNPPAYPPFFATVAEVSRSIVEVPLDMRGERAALDFDALERAFASGARAYLFCNPHNPVGRAFCLDDVRRIATLAERYGVTVLADEIHAPLVLPGAHHVPFESIARETGVRSITLTSASKGWNIAGLKCAIAVSESTWGRATLARLPKDLADRTGHLGVIATIAAFSSDASYLDRVVSHLDVLRETLRRLLAEHGLGAIRYARPDAGFLAWLDCRALDLGPDPSKKFLEDGGVAFTNGLDFGREGSGHVRFNFGTSTGLVEEAVRRMRTALDVERGRRGDVHSPTNL